MSKKNIILMLGDITSIGVDALVNSANKSMLPGSGLSRAIHHKAGDEVKEYCATHFRKNGFFGVNDVFVTPAGRLPAKYIFHAVGPKWHEEEDRAESLIRTYFTILMNAQLYEVRTISIPSISTGIHKYPVEFTADIVLDYLVESLPKFDHIENVLLVFASRKAALSYSQKAATMNVQSVQIINLIPDGMGS